jgi:hypothetical protein
MISFRLSRSTTRDVPVVEVWADDRFIATIYPSDALRGDASRGDGLCAISVISKYLEDVVVDPSSPPAAVIFFDLDP